MSTSEQFSLAAAADGLQISEVVPGKLVRCKVVGDRGGKRSGAYRYFDNDFPGGIWWNWKSGARGTWTARQDLTPAERVAHHLRIEQAERERKAKQSRQWQVNLTRNRQLLGNAKTISPGDPVAQYLASRGLPVPIAPHSLHFAPTLPYYDDGECLGNFPVMLAGVTGPDNHLVSVHRTYLTPDGEKADVPTVKKLTPASGSMAGAAIRIGHPDVRPDGVALAVAEGIETALAFTALHGVACWAAVSANGLQSFIPPSSVNILFIAADNDESGTGQRAAQTLATRMAAAGIVARVCMPPDVGTDWADVQAQQISGGTK